MKIYRIIFAAIACTVLAASCNKPSASIDVTVAGTPDKDIVIKMLDINTYTVLDTVRTDASGHFTYQFDVVEGQPEFVYLFNDDVKISSLLLQYGDKITVRTDASGRNPEIEGSQESVRLQENERSFADFVKLANAAQTKSQFTSEYVKYYRTCVKYVMSNSHSLTIVPVLFQNVNPDFPVFSQTTDALQFRAAVDSLKTVYPDSKYVRALENETKRRESLLALDNQLSAATEVSYPDITSKDINGSAFKLSELDAKAILINFWTVTDASSKIFNQETLKPLYEKYHSLGLEIVQISVDTDKAVWASVVKNQEIPWISLNDGLGSSSTTLALYNVSALPQSFLIVNGEIYDKALKGNKQFESVLDKALK